MKYDKGTSEKQYEGGRGNCSFPVSEGSERSERRKTEGFRGAKRALGPEQ